MKFVKKVGSGAYGTVCSFENTVTGERVAVKKIQNAFDDLIDAKRILRYLGAFSYSMRLREIKILRHFNHDNIIRILDMYPPEVATSPVGDYQLFFLCSLSTSKISTS